MTDLETTSLEEQIDQWRSYLRRRQAIHSVDVAELEDHLREQVAGLVDAGLATDEAFLVAVKRMGALDALSREFAREHSERLWKQLVVVPSDAGEPQAARTDAIVAFCLAVLAAALIKLPELFGIELDGDRSQGVTFYARNLSLFVLPPLTGYFIWKRGIDGGAQRRIVIALLAFVAAGVFANVYPFSPTGNTELLTSVHLPIALWLVVGIAYAGGRWGQVEGRMDFIRFSGELFIYYVLIALGGGVLTGFMALLFQAIGIDPETFLTTWLVPCGAAGAVIVGSWLVEAKQSVVENMAPVLTRLFSPLFATVLVAFLGTLLLTGRGISIERNLLIAFDLLLAVVLALLLYSLSAREPRAAPGAFDVVQVVLVVSALAADAIALWAIAGRVSEFGFSPNRVAALGENVILLVNLVWSAVLYVRFLRGGGSLASLE
ncbi:MAG TPA: permease prefix domain 1-containing protein, partial [Chloroflexota bacterium]|nr:permease prefix domain 1-containing protein [Chloroflexota bacterium]